MSNKKLMFYLIMLVLSIPQFTYRFNHPEKSETQLFLEFFNAYGEFFNVCKR